MAIDMESYNLGKEEAAIICEDYAAVFERGKQVLPAFLCGNALRDAAAMIRGRKDE